MRSLWAVAVLSLASCMPYVDATSTPYTGVEKFAPIDPAATVADIDAKLREEAAKMGANAIYVIDGGVSAVDKQRKLVAIAIRIR